MNQERLMKVLLAPMFTEKSNRLSEKHNQVSFKVARDATKSEIKGAMKLLFEVDAIDVQIVNVRGKRARHGRSEGWRSNWKKAYIRLAPGQDINFGDSA